MEDWEIAENGDAAEASPYMYDSSEEKNEPGKKYFVLSLLNFFPIDSVASNFWSSNNLQCVSN